MCFFCFPSNATVITQLNQVLRVCDLEIGDVVKVMNEDGSVGFSPVYGWAHNDSNVEASFLQLHTDSQRTITLSKDHLILIRRSKGGSTRQHHHLFHKHDGTEFEFVQAGDVQEGDEVVQVHAFAGAAGVAAVEQFQPARVTGRTILQSKGIYAPLTMEGTVVVDGTVASCYAATHSHTAAHAALAPARAQFRLRGPQSMAKHHSEKDGKRFHGALNYVDRLGRIRYHNHK
jgi:hedgehog protein